MPEMARAKRRIWRGERMQFQATAQNRDSFV
jgi:hypothetical protein